MLKSQKYSIEIALQKMVQWCNKAERCHWDVRQKLIAWGIQQDDRENIIAHLISQNLLNEKRYAEAFVHDKFELNKWGTRKIEQHLKLKGISEVNIREALKQIPAQDNSRVILDLIKKKGAQLTGLNPSQKKMKLARYLTSKGFESDAVWAVLKSV